MSKRQSVLSSAEPVPKLKDWEFQMPKLGSGSYASVYKARKKGTQQVSAIKCIKKSSLNKASTDNLLREIEILKEIKHPHIVPMLDFQWDANYIYILLEMCKGGDLSQFIKSRRTVSEQQAKRFVQQIASALKHLHSLGIAHMDLKPQNILLTSSSSRSSVLKMADFGFAQYMRVGEEARSLRGSPLYMAPEILKNRKYDSRVDLWSVGVILHEVIFGYAPFVSSSMVELEQKIKSDSPIQIPQHIKVSESCRDLLRSLLRRNPDERISFDSFFAHPFIDLEHMASEQSLPKASELLIKATSLDQAGDFDLAQRLYLKSIEFLLPAIQHEQDPKKKQAIREKAKMYLKRSEDLANIISRNTNTNKNTNDTPSSSSTTKKAPNVVEIPVHHIASSPNGINRPSIPSFSNNYNPFNRNSTTPITLPINNQTTAAECRMSILTPNRSGVGVTSIDCNNQIDPSILNMLKLVDGSEKVQDAIRMCLDADEKSASNSTKSNKDLFEQYSNGLTVLLAYVKNLDDGELSRLLKTNIEKWLCKAEQIKKVHNKNSIKERQRKTNSAEIKEAREFISEDENEQQEEDTKQCCIQ